MCLQFNEIYAHCIKVEDSVILKKRKRPIAKRQLANNVFEHFCVPTRDTKDDRVVFVLIMSSYRWYYGPKINQ